MASVSRLNVLVIDEDEGSNAETKAVLTEAGHDVQVLTDPSGIATEFKHRRFDLVLLDVSWPDSATSEWLQQIRATDAELAVIAMSSGPAMDLPDG